MAARYTEHGMDRMETMGTWQAAAFYLIAGLTYLASLAGAMLLMAVVLSGVHWALAVPVFGVTATSFTVGFWFGLRQLGRISRPTSEKWLRILGPLLVPPAAAWVMISALIRGSVLDLALAAFMAFALLDVVSYVVLRLTLHRDLSATLIIGRLVRAALRRAAEKISV